MSIKILDPVKPREDVDFTISHQDAFLIMRIRDKIGMIDAIRVLRMYNNKCGLRQAKEFVESLNL